MVDADLLYVGLGGIAILGTLAFVRGHVVHSLQKNFRLGGAERQRIEDLIDATTKMGSLERIYQRPDGHFRDHNDRGINVFSGRPHILKLEGADSLHSKDYLQDKLFAVRKLGESEQAHYFSLTDPSYFGQTGLAYALTFHRKQGD